MGKWVKGKIKRILTLLSRKRKSILKWSLGIGGVFLCCYIFGYVLNCFIAGGFHFKASGWLLFDGKTFVYSGVFFMLFIFIALFYYHKTLRYTHGDELPCLQVGGEYTVSLYDRLGNGYSFTVYIIGNPATIYSAFNRRKGFTFP